MNHLHHYSERTSELGTLALTIYCVLQLLIAANGVPNSLILFSLMTDLIRSSDTSLPTRARRHHVPEDGMLHLTCCNINHKVMYVFREGYMYIYELFCNCLLPNMISKTAQFRLQLKTNINTSEQIIGRRQGL
jgi:hypothetical protein